MKYLRCHPIKESIDIQQDIEMLQDIYDIFINLEDNFDIKVWPSFFKYIGDPDRHPMEKSKPFKIYNVDGTVRTEASGGSGPNSDAWQIVFSGGKMGNGECQKIYESSKILIEQCKSLTGLELHKSSGLSLPSYSDMKIKTFKFGEEINFALCELDFGNFDSITGLLIFTKQ